MIHYDSGVGHRSSITSIETFHSDLPFKPSIRCMSCLLSTLIWRKMPQRRREKSTLLPLPANPVQVPVKLDGIVRHHCLRERQLRLRLRIDGGNRRDPDNPTSLACRNPSVGHPGCCQRGVFLFLFLLVFLLLSPLLFLPVLPSRR